MARRKSGLSAHERRYIAVLAAVVLLFMTVGIAMEHLQTFQVSQQVPVRVEALLMEEPRPDTATLTARGDTLGRKQVRTPAKSPDPKKKLKKSGVRKPTDPAPAERRPVHTAPIPTD